MNNYKSLKKQLKFCIKTMNDSSSLFVVDSNKDFTRKDTFNKLGYKAEINNYTASCIN